VRGVFGYRTVLQRRDLRKTLSRPEQSCRLRLQDGLSDYRRGSTAITPDYLYGIGVGACESVNARCLEIILPAQIPSCGGAISSKLPTSLFTPSREDALKHRADAPFSGSLVQLRQAHRAAVPALIKAVFEENGRESTCTKRSFSNLPTKALQGDGRCNTTN
jgi:hypothetical protein